MCRTGCREEHGETELRKGLFHSNKLSSSLRTRDTHGRGAVETDSDGAAGWVGGCRPRTLLYFLTGGVSTDDGTAEARSEAYLLLQSHQVCLPSFL